MGTDNDRRVLLAIALIMVVYYVWVAFISPPPPPVAPTDPVVAQAPAVPTAAPSIAAPTASAEPVVSVPDRREAVGSDTWRGSLTSEAGGLSDLTLKDYTTSPVVSPVWTWALAKVTGGAEGGWQPYAGGDEPYRLLTADGALGVAGVGALGSDKGYLIEASGQGFTARRTLPSGLVITKRYQPGEDPHTLQVEVEFDNRSGAAVDRLWVGVVDQMVAGAGRFDNVSRPQAVVDGDIEHLLDLEDLAGEETERLEGPVSWVGVGDRYFMASLALEEPLTGAAVFDTLPDGRSGAFVVDGQALDAGASRTYRFLAYMGPKDLDLLQRLGHELDEAVEFGFFGFFSRMLLFLLKVAQKGVVNWGLAIMALTLLVKAVFYPLTQRAFVSGKKMQALQPLMKEVQEKYKDNKELQSVETMKLFTEHGVNPMGGCLPTLVQMPVWFALYGVMLNSVELFDSSFLYLKDLTAADPYGVLPVLYAILIVWQQHLTPMTGLDPAQQKMMKLLPLVFAFMMFTFPSGLVLYFCVNILLTVFQQWLINRTFDAASLQRPATT
jgi:YidC/Oxa1 family membrane protein insertase